MVVGANVIGSEIALYILDKKLAYTFVQLAGTDVTMDKLSVIKWTQARVNCFRETIFYSGNFFLISSSIPLTGKES